MFGFILSSSVIALCNLDCFFAVFVSVFLTSSASSIFCGTSFPFSTSRTILYFGFASCPAAGAATFSAVSFVMLFITFSTCSFAISFFSSFCFEDVFGCFFALGSLVVFAVFAFFWRESFAWRSISSKLAVSETLPTLNCSIDLTSASTKISYACCTDNVSLQPYGFLFSGFSCSVGGVSSFGCFLTSPKPMFASYCSFIACFTSSKFSICGLFSLMYSALARSTNAVASGFLPK